jgi:hypothetical protein
MEERSAAQDAIAMLTASEHGYGSRQILPNTATSTLGRWRRSSPARCSQRSRCASGADGVAEEIERLGVRWCADSPG